MRQQRRGLQLDWGKATPPSRDSVVDYATLQQCPEKESLRQELLNKIAIVKLNGGLGTSMGCGKSSKSAIHVRGGLSFLDLCVRAVEHLNTKHSVDVPLLLMNSFR
jgi:UTP--glucose-1-phosphate uridylyltransferase